MFLSTIQSFKENSPIDVTIPIRKGNLRVKAQVMYSQPGIGIGIMFVDLSEQQKIIIKNLINDLSKPLKNDIECKKILLVEDDEIVRNDYKDNLLGEGFIVVEASNGIDAINAIVESIPDLIILDLYMKKMDGLKVLSILKIHPLWKVLPIVVCSARATKDLMKKVLQAGVDEFIDKRITTPIGLPERIKTVLQCHNK
jgi:CheY-like chemotaxis protein